MIEIELFDGTVLEFPEGTPQDVLDRVARQETQARQQEAPAPQEPKSWGQTLKENILGDDDPTTQNFGEKVGTALNKAGEAMTFGLIGDEASAAAAAAIPGGMGYDERLAYERGQERLLEETNPGVAFGSELGGSIVGAMLPFGAIGTLGRGAGMGARIAASGAAGAGMGATYGFMEGEGDERLSDARTGAGWGAAAGVIAPVIGAGVQKIADKLVQRGPIRQAVKTAKSAAEQRAASGQSYKAFRDADAQMSLPAFQRMVGQVDDAMRAVEPSTNIPGPLGKPSKTYGKIVKSLRGMDDVASTASVNPNTTGISLGSVEDVRQAIGPLARELNQNFRPTRGAVSAMRATDAIDQFIDTLGPDDIVAGDKDAAISALTKARDLWRRSIKTQKVENAMDAAGDYLSGTESGLRNQFKTLLRQDKKANLFTDAERAFLKKVIGGNMLSRLVRTVGDGLGRKAALFTGGAMGGLEGAAIGAAAGEAASRIGEAAAMRNAEIARALVSSGALANLPVAPEAVRRISETLMRRIGAAGPQ